jgi:hypothetical protein
MVWTFLKDVKAGPIWEGCVCVGGGVMNYPGHRGASAELLRCHTCDSSLRISVQNFNIMLHCECGTPIITQAS